MSRDFVKVKLSNFKATVTYQKLRISEISILELRPYGYFLDKTILKE